MTGREQVEDARAGREAVSEVAGRATGGPVSRETGPAMQRYLAAEAYHEKRVEEERRSEDSETEAEPR